MVGVAGRTRARVVSQQTTTPRSPREHARSRAVAAAANRVAAALDRAEAAPLDEGAHPARRGGLGCTLMAVTAGSAS
jgi:hypothetical protein